jgi:acyl carrier protein
MEQGIDEFITKFKDELDVKGIQIFPETDFINTEYWDSLSAMAEMVMIESDYGKILEVEDFEKFRNVQELYEFVIS